jgi:hypothetical protein
MERRRKGARVMAVSIRSRSRDERWPDYRERFRSWLAVRAGNATHLIENERAVLEPSIGTSIDGLRAANCGTGGDPLRSLPARARIRVPFVVPAMGHCRAFRRATPCVAQVHGKCVPHSISEKTNAIRIEGREGDPPTTNAAVPSRRAKHPFHTSPWPYSPRQYDSSPLAGQAGRELSVAAVHSSAVPARARRHVASDTAGGARTSPGTPGSGRGTSHSTAMTVAASAARGDSEKGEAQDARKGPPQRFVHRRSSYS